MIKVILISKRCIQVTAIVDTQDILRHYKEKIRGVNGLEFTRRVQNKYKKDALRGVAVLLLTLVQDGVGIGNSRHINKYVPPGMTGSQ